MPTSNNESAKPRSRWLLLVGAVLVLLAGAVAALWMWVRADHGFTAMRERIDRLQREAEERPAERPVPFGEAAPGRAFADYLAAAQALDRLLEESEDADLTVIAVADQEPAQWQYVTPTEIPAAVWKCVDQARPALELLERGVRRRDPRRAIDWSAGYLYIDDLHLPAMGCIPGYCILDAWRMVAAGDHEAATRRLLSAAWLAEDCYRDPVTIICQFGIDLQADVVGAFLTLQDEESTKRRIRPWLSLETWPRADLKSLARAVSLLDRDPSPLADRLRSEAILLTRMVDMPGGFDQMVGLDWSWANYGFSSRRIVVDALETLLAVSSEVEGLGPGFPAADKFLSSRYRLDEMKNPLLKMVFPDLQSMLAADHDHRVAIRVMRLAIADALGETLELQDPFGGTLRRLVVDGRTRYVSRGPDCVDHGGDVERDIVYVK